MVERNRLGPEFAPPTFALLECSDVSMALLERRPATPSAASLRCSGGCEGGELGECDQSGWFLPYRWMRSLDYLQVARHSTEL